MGITTTSESKWIPKWHPHPSLISHPWKRDGSSTWWKSPLNQRISHISKNTFTINTTQKDNISITGFPVSSAGKESTCNAGDPGLIPGLGRPPGEGIGYSLQYSWASLVAQTVKNPPATWETYVFNPWVRKILWRREWQPTPVFLPGESPWTKEPGGLQSMGLQEMDTTKQLSTARNTHTHTHTYSLSIHVLTDI